MKILNLKVKNYKGVKEIEVTPGEDNVLEITGGNGEGKSSVIEAIRDALKHKEAGKQNIEPIRKGQEKAEIEIDFGEYTVERVFTEKGSYLRLKDDMGKIGSPQARIDAWLGDVSFDPSKFIKMDNKERIETLLNLGGVGEEVADIEEQIKELYDDRRMIGREKKNKKGTLENYDKEIAKIDVDKVDTKSLKKELEKIEEIENEKKELESRYERGEKFIGDKKEDIEKNKKEINRLKEKIKELENKNDKNKEKIKQAENKNKGISEKIEDKKEELNNKDKDRIREKINKAEDINEKYRKKKEYEKVYDEYIKKQTEYKQMTENINKLKEEKKSLINKVDIDKSVDVQDGNLYINNTPFEQINTAEKLKLSLEIGSLANSEIKVMRLQDGNDFDKNNMKLLKEFAEENDYQIWVERIVKSGENEAIRIKAGKLE